MRRRPVDRSLVALGAVVLASTGARFALSRGVAAPWIAPDEQLYGMLARSLVDGDGLRVLGESVPNYGTFCPLLVGLPFPLDRLVRLPGVDSPGAVPQEVARTRPDGRLAARDGTLRGICVLKIQSDGLIGSTRVEFVRR